MRFIAKGALGAMLGTTALLALTAAPAMAATTATNGSEVLNIATPFAPVNSSAGVPNANGNQGVITGSGFTPGMSVYFQICDGTPGSSPQFSPSLDCGPAGGANVVNAQGNIKVNAQLNPLYLYHGQDPFDSFFNCLAPADDPNAANTVVGDQPIDSSLPACGATLGGNASGGGSAACQIRFGYLEGSYSSTDIFVPITGLDGPASYVGTEPGAPSLTPPANTPESPLTIALPVAGAAVLAGGAAFALRRRRRHSPVAV